MNAQHVRWQVVAGVGLLVAIAIFLFWRQVGVQFMLGIFIPLAAVGIVAWLAYRLPPTMRRLVISLLVIATPVLVFMNLSVGCVMTTGFGGPSCWWEQI